MPQKIVPERRLLEAAQYIYTRYLHNLISYIEALPRVPVTLCTSDRMLDEFFASCREVDADSDVDLVRKLQLFYKCLSTTHIRLNTWIANIQYALNECPIRILTHLSSWRIYNELCALQNEFGVVSYDSDLHTLSVPVGPVTLRDVDLGTFNINLDIDELVISRHNFYSVTNDDPQPAHSDDSVIHPHVASDALCPGDAVMPIAAAGAECRILDFFLLVSQVLTSYNPDNAYVKLEDWCGLTCDLCGSSCDVDEMRICQRCGCTCCCDCSYDCCDCGRVFCDNCGCDICAGCRGLLCGACSNSCVKCSAIVCYNCRAYCHECEAELCTSCYSAGDGYCPGCIEQFSREANDDDDDSDDDADSDDDVEESAAQEYLCACCGQTCRSQNSRDLRTCTSCARVMCSRYASVTCAACGSSVCLDSVCRKQCDRCYVFLCRRCYNHYGRYCPECANQLVTEQEESNTEQNEATPDGQESESSNESHEELAATRQGIVEERQQAAAETPDI